MQQYHLEKQIVYSLAFLLAILILASCVMPKLPVAITPGSTRPATPFLTPDETGETPTATDPVTIENTQWQLLSFGLKSTPTAPLENTPVITPGATFTATETVTTSTASSLFAAK